jgi:hypothetical protein
MEETYTLRSEKNCLKAAIPNAPRMTEQSREEHIIVTDMWGERQNVIQRH